MIKIWASQLAAYKTGAGPTVILVPVQRRPRRGRFPVALPATSPPLIASICGRGGFEKRRLECDDNPALLDNLEHPPIDWCGDSKKSRWEFLRFTAARARSSECSVTCRRIGLLTTLCGSISWLRRALPDVATPDVRDEKRTRPPADAPI